VYAPVRLRRLLDEAFVLYHVQHFRNLVFSNVPVGVFAPAELQRKADLVSIGQKFADLAELVVDVADIGSGMELYLLYLRLLLRTASLLLSDRLFVFELAVVHDLADRRLSVRSDLNEIQPPAFRQSLRVTRRHDAQHLPLTVKNTHLRYANLVVYASELSDNPPLFVLLMFLFILPNT